MTRLDEIAALHSYEAAVSWGYRLACSGVVLTLEQEQALARRKIELKEAEKR